jgi:uncharacterized membrane protein YeiH
MNQYNGIRYILEIVGTIAFASSGAMTGIKKNMDIFGVNVLGIVTALGGGLIRDLILGISPPNMFRDPSYVSVAIITSCILFSIIYFKKSILNSKFMEKYERVMIAMDTIGLSTFTVIGINVGIEKSYGNQYFLLIFLGVMTGVGGGMIRDIMAGNTPYVLVKHVYACASIAGATICVLLKNKIGNMNAMVLGAVVVGVIRYFAIKKKWNLPRI